MNSEIPKEAYYDEPTRIMEIINEDPELYKLIQWFYKKLEENTDKEKLREFSRKRWKEYLEEHAYKPTPEQEQYNLTDWKKIEEKYFKWQPI